MKRGLLIGVGTLGGLGAVFAITPPQFGSNTGAGGISGALNGSTTKSAASAQTQAPATQATSAAPTPTPTKATASKTSSAAKKAAAKAAASKAASAATKAASTPTPAAPTPTPTKATTAGVSGTFAGATNQTRFGPVQVQITVSSGKITAVRALQYPNGDPRSANISQQAIPYLVQQTLTAQSDQISGVGGASYTSYGFYISLQSALKKAGL
jgi:uncharacterized protein with FMN-binding domain